MTDANDDYGSLLFRLDKEMRRIAKPSAEAIRALLKERDALQQRLDQLLGVKK